MDRIEDETVRYLYFLQVSTGAPVMPFPTEEEEVEADGEPQQPSQTEQQRVAAKTSMEGFTRKIQRTKDREMEALQRVGAAASSAPAPRARWCAEPRSRVPINALGAAARNIRSATDRRPALLFSQRLSRIYHRRAPCGQGCGSEGYGNE